MINRLKSPKNGLTGQISSKGLNIPLSCRIALNRIVASPFFTVSLSESTISSIGQYDILNQ